MKMTHAQYIRIETQAGGVGASTREFIRAARARLSDQGKARANREARRAWILHGLELKSRAKDFV